MKKKVLIIDDNPLNNEKYFSLVRETYDVDIEMTIDGAEYDLAGFHYDLVVIDIMMPVQGVKANNELSTGLFFYRERVEGRYPGLKVLFWSNLTSEPYLQFFKDKKCDLVFFLQKNRKNTAHLKDFIDTII